MAGKSLGNGDSTTRRNDPVGTLPVITSKAKDEKSEADLLASSLLACTQTPFGKIAQHKDPILATLQETGKSNPPVDIGNRIENCLP